MFVKLTKRYLYVSQQHFKTYKTTKISKPHIVHVCDNLDFNT